MRINTNISAIKVSTKLAIKGKSVEKSMERLSSGVKISRAVDDPSGLAISKKMNTQIKSLEQSSQNATDGVSLLDTAETAIGEIQAMLQRMRELTVQASNETNSIEDKQAIQYEMDELSGEIDRIANTTEFNGKKLLDGSFERRTYSSNQDVLPVSVSTNVPSGLYTIEFESSGTAATVTGMGFDGTDASTKITQAQAGILSVNGLDIEIVAGETYKEAYDRIKIMCDKVDVIVSQDLTTFTSKYMGSDETVNIECNSKVNTLFGFATPNPDDDVSIKSKGDDAKVALSESFQDTAVVRAKGNFVTVTDYNGFEFKLKASDNFTGEATMEVTDIGTLNLQIGANENQMTHTSIPKISKGSLEIDKLNVLSYDKAQLSLEKIDFALLKVSDVRAKFGAAVNTLEHTISHLNSYSMNMTASYSGIVDTDMAEEMTYYTTQNTLSQAATAMLSQANSRPEMVLQLLR